MSYEKRCPVCGDKFVTKYSTKVFCCVDCVAEYNDIKSYIFKKMRQNIIHTIIEARQTTKTPQQLAREFFRKC